jgi:hypothetical protein
VGGVALIAIGIVGFFYSASFGTPGTVEEALGVFDVNGWFNMLYLAAGSLALLAATAAARAFALCAGTLFTVVGVWSLALGGGEAILGLVPTGTGSSLLALTVGLLGLAAAAGTPSEARAQVAGDRL